MSDQETASKSRAKKSRHQVQVPKQSEECDSAEPTSPSVRVSAATIRLFSVGDGEGERKSSSGGDSDIEGSATAIAVADKLAGKNPRWLAAQEKLRLANAIRDRIQTLLVDIEAEEAKDEPVAKKSWLETKRLELRKIVIKQPEDIIESEAFVGKVEKALTAAPRKLSKGKSARRGRSSNKKGARSVSDSDEDNPTRDETDEEMKTNDDSDSSGEDPKDSLKDSKEKSKKISNRKREENASALVDGPTKDKKSSKIGINKKTRVSYLRDSDEQKVRQNQEQGKSAEECNEENKQGDQDVKNKDRSDSESKTGGQRKTQDTDGPDESKLRKSKARVKEGKEERPERANENEEEKNSGEEGMAEKGKGKKWKIRREKPQELKENSNKKDKQKQDEGQGNRKAKGENKKYESDEERSESESESSRRKWKKPVIRLPSWKKGSDKSCRGTAAAERTEAEGDSAGGGSGSSEGRGGSGGSSRGGSEFFWGERIDRPKESATKPKRRLSIDSHDKQPSASDDEASETQSQAFVLEIDAGTFSGDEKVSEVAIKELPTSGKRGREKRKKKGESQTARKESVIPDIPVLHESIKQKLRDTFSIKRKPKRSDTTGEQSDGGGGDKEKKKDKAKKKETIKEKKNGRKDESRDKNGNPGTNNTGSGSPMVIRATEKDSKQNKYSSPTWRGPSTTPGTSRINDAMHCISLDDD